MAPKKTTKKGGPQKRPSAEKRILTAQKRYLINQSFKSKAKTMMKKFEAALKAGDQSSITSGLQLVYSVADKAVKRGIFKNNKAARIKSRATLRANVKI
ncbi:30S ribosomal protein S20 [Chlamydia caviae]|uniref:Small ribosomal subunit protein bS20 n=1 Tax=Chlamydia caviae (strain ATCC VR-813 / DSM 19441 / 03DC25 / GPIC) TaxID=227941 RepID=RS20_CHLCV|nr:30S ribosomal protein S20 [Chlamydia caviae]Q821D9.1 RecName: Full=Small ribosomal subunit protein bS20; AltName: Full=30S ribosomal protein S20 [Chlamydia caviae GPIC]AAP05742.1 ribosomal protein S20 [Chlamydia caviae GPIC]